MPLRSLSPVFPEVSNTPFHRHHHRRCRSFHLCGTAGKRWRYALFQADERRPPFHRFFLPQQPPLPSPAAAFTAIYRSISYVDWIHGGFSGGPSLAPPRCDYEFFGIIPVYRSFARLDRARNVLATRFCLKREFHSRIRKTHSSCPDYLSFHGETALRKGARQLLPAAKMILQLHIHTICIRIFAELKRLRISDLNTALYNRNISIFSRVIIEFIPSDLVSPSPFISAEYSEIFKS